MSKPKSKKPRQKALPGMGTPRNTKIEKLADDYVDKRDRRMNLLTEEVNARDLLDIAMKEAGLTTYEYDGQIVRRVVDEKIKVEKKKQPKDAE